MFQLDAQSKKKMSNCTFIKIRTRDLVRLGDLTECKLCLGNLVARGLGRKTIYYNESIACRGWSHGSYVILCEVRRRRLEISATKLIGRGLTGEYCNPPGTASEQVSPKGVRDLNKSATRVRR